MVSGQLKLMIVITNTLEIYCQNKTGISKQYKMEILTSKCRIHIFIQILICLLMKIFRKMNIIRLLCSIASRMRFLVKVIPGWSI